MLNVQWNNRVEFDTRHTTLSVFLVQHTRDCPQMSRKCYVALTLSAAVVAAAVAGVAASAAGRIATPAAAAVCTLYRARRKLRRRAPAVREVPTAVGVNTGNLVLRDPEIAPSLAEGRHLDCHLDLTHHMS